VVAGSWEKFKTHLDWLYIGCKLNSTEVCRQVNPVNLRAYGGNITSCSYIRLLNKLGSD